MSKEAMKLALEALGLLVEERSSEAMDDGYKAIKALEEALAKQEQGAPVAWRHCANEWADATYNALQHLKNVRDGYSAEAAIANMEVCIKHCKDVQVEALKSPQPKQEQGEPVAWQRKHYPLCKSCKRSTIPMGDTCGWACDGTEKSELYCPKTEEQSVSVSAQHVGEPVGVMVSMDVSKGDEPEHRIFGRIYEVQEDGDGVTYLAIEDSRNFDTTLQPCQTCEALARTVMLDQSSHDTTQQRTWVELTEEDIEKTSGWVDWSSKHIAWNFAIKIEQLLKEKNT